MWPFRRKASLPRELTRVERRARMLTTDDLVVQAETLVSVMGPQYTAWRRGKDENAMFELRMSAEALSAVLREIDSRP